MKKEEIINEGLQLAYGNLIAPKVKVDIKQDKHEKDVKKDQCKWCEEKAPYSDEFCSINCFLNWKLLEENEKIETSVTQSSSPIFNPEIRTITLPLPNSPPQVS